MIAVVFPTYGKWFLTNRCIQSVYKSVDPGNEKNVLVVVVDNGSPDDTVENLKKYYPDVVLLPQKENLGFAKACNIGMTWVRAEHPDADILITNNDVEFERGCIEALKSFAYSDETYGVVGGKLLQPTGEIQHAGAFIGNLGWGVHIGAGATDIPIFNVPRECEYVTGALFFIKRRTLDQVGLFDEKFSPAYFEETDYCYRVRQRGLKVMYNPRAVAIHTENSTGRELYGDNLNKISHANQLKFWRNFEDTYYANPIPGDTIRVLVSTRVFDIDDTSTVVLNMCRAMSRRGIDVSIAPDEYYDTSYMPNWEIQNMIRKRKDWWNRIVIRCGPSSGMTSMPPADIHIGYVFQQSTVCEPVWIDQLQHMSEIWVPSKRSGKSLIESGLADPVVSTLRTVECCVNTDIFHLNAPVVPLDRDFGFNFIACTKMSNESGLDTVLRAYGQEFKQGEDVSLVLYCPNLLGTLTSLRISVEDFIMQHAGEGHAPITLAIQNQGDEYLAGLLVNSDCFVSSHRMDMTGLNLLQATACGLPSIVIPYGAHEELCEKVQSLPVTYELESIPLQPVPHFRNYIGGKWANPDIESLRKQMRWAFEHRDEMNRRADAGLTYVLEHHSLEHIGEELVDILSQPAWNYGTVDSREQGDDR